MLSRARSALSKNLARSRAKLAVRRGLYDGIDVEAIAQIARNFEDHQYQKYYRKMHHAHIRNAARCYALGLPRSPELRILDIGSGFGYFAYAAGQFGHRVVGLDMDDPFFNIIAPMMGIQRVLHRIEAFQPLPEIPGAPFDLITAFAPCFDNPQAEGQWDVDEWKFFLNDLRRFMSPGCRLYIKFNQYLVDGTFPRKGFSRRQAMSHALVDHFRSLNASFGGRTMDLVDAPAALEASRTNGA